MEQMYRCESCGAETGLPGETPAEATPAWALCMSCLMALRINRETAREGGRRQSGEGGSGGRDVA